MKLRSFWSYFGQIWTLYGQIAVLSDQYDKLDEVGQLWDLPMNSRAWADKLGRIGSEVEKL